MSFELEFRGALSRYLRSRGYDVYRIHAYRYDDDRELQLGYYNSSNEFKVLWIGVPMQELMEQL